MVLLAMQRDIQAGVAAVVKQVLGTVPDADQPLMEAGLDSLGAVELRNALTAQFAIQLPATLIFNYPSIAAIAAFLSTATVQGEYKDFSAESSFSQSLSEVRSQLPYILMSEAGLSGALMPLACSTVSTHDIQIDAFES